MTVALDDVTGYAQEDSYRRRKSPRKVLDRLTIFYTDVLPIGIPSIRGLSYVFLRVMKGGLEPRTLHKYRPTFGV